MIQSSATYTTELRNETGDDLIMLEDTARGTLCAIHKSVNSGNRFPDHHQQQAMHVCPMPNNYCQQNNTLNSTLGRSRRRSRSPREDNSALVRSAYSACHNWPSTPNSSSCSYHHHNAAVNNNFQNIICPSPNCPSRKCASQINQCPGQSSSFVHVEKANSCPDRTCSCASKFSNSSASKAPESRFIQSQSVLQGVNVGATHSQIAQQLVCTDGIVTELKDEIEKVKYELRRMHLNNADRPAKITYDCINDGDADAHKLIHQLKTENKQLKKELVQKRKLQQASVKNVEKAKDIMSDYEKKVGLLHDQAIKSSKVMRQSKERFCRCLEEKEAIIQDLQIKNESLKVGLNEQVTKFTQLNSLYEDLQENFVNNNGECVALSGNNKEYVQCIEILQKQLECARFEADQYKEDVKKLQNELSNSKCNECQKLEAKIKKQKEKYESRLKESEENATMFKSQISLLSDRLKEMESENMSIEELQRRCNELQEKVIENDTCVSKCRILEERCKRQYETTVHKENQFEKERQQMRQLVDELTTVVKQNKITLLQLSTINKQQEVMLESQCSLLSQKEQMIRMAESTIEILETKSSELEREVNDLKLCMRGPCNKESCLELSRELQEIRAALNREKDNQLVKQKIIEDQSQTICCLQQQIKEKMLELSKAREQTNEIEGEMMRINDHLSQKHQDLERELDEKEDLLEKMKKLEHQKTLLSFEMEELEKLLHRYCDAQQYDEKQQMALINLQKQLELQRNEWETQKENLAVEKEKAVCAAKFATQKLLDTVSDFQKQVDAQKKVQVMLTKMLRNKEEELKNIKSKVGGDRLMSSINTITSELNSDASVREIFKRNELDLSNPATQTSFYSSCSNCSKCTPKTTHANPKQAEIQKLFYLLTETEPVKNTLC